MGIFDFFKKQEPPKGGDYTVQDLQEGYIIDFDFESWKVEHIGTYDWGNEEFTYEATIFNGKERKYLDFSDDPTSENVLYSDVKTSKLPSSLFTLLEQGQKPNRELVWNGEKFILEESSVGFYSETNGNKKDWEEVMNFTYLSEKGTYLSIDQWDEDDFECSSGQILSLAMIEQILPAN